MKISPFRGLYAGIVLLVFIGSALVVRHLNQPRIIARAIAPNGLEFCIVQMCNWSAEPFTTSCYYRKPGGPWGWFYYDHQDWYWSKSPAEIDPEEKVITCYREGKAVVKFYYETETYHTFRNEVLNRNFTTAQAWMPAGWDLTAK